MWNPQKLFSLDRHHGLSMKPCAWAAEAAQHVPSVSAAETVAISYPGRENKYLGFMSHTNSVTTIHLCCCSMKASINYHRNKRSYIPSCFMGVEIWISCHFHVLWNDIRILLFSNLAHIQKIGNSQIWPAAWSLAPLISGSCSPHGGRLDLQDRPAVWISCSGFTSPQQHCFVDYPGNVLE